MSVDRNILFALIFYNIRGMDMTLAEEPIEKLFPNKELKAMIIPLFLEQLLFS